MAETQGGAIALWRGRMSHFASRVFASRVFAQAGARVASTSSASTLFGGAAIASVFAARFVGYESGCAGGGEAPLDKKPHRPTTFANDAVREAKGFKAMTDFFKPPPPPTQPGRPAGPIKKRGPRPAAAASPASTSTEGASRGTPTPPLPAASSSDASSASSAAPVSGKKAAAQMLTTMMEKGEVRYEKLSDKAKANYVFDLRQAKSNDEQDEEQDGIGRDRTG